MRTIATINQKGGCGKTTVSINLAATLAARGHRTLLVDMDPQSHCALGLAVPDAQIERSIRDLLKAGLNGSLGFRDVVWQVSRNLDLAPSTMALAGIEQELSGSADKDRRLAHILGTIENDYDYCVIDCPPSIGLLTFNALRAAQEVLIPVETGYFALQGSVKQEATIEMLAERAGHRVRFSVLATMYDVRTKMAREILSELKRHFGARLLPVVVHFNSKLKESASFGQPITEYDPASRGMQDFEKLAMWLESHPPELARIESTATPSDPPVPVKNRAAELVERARALTARTESLSSKLKADPKVPKAMSVTGKPVATQPDGAVVERVARAYGVRYTNQGLLFVQPANRTTASMQIAGDFNNWVPHRTPLRWDGKLGVYQACVSVSPGRYRYRLVIDGQWRQDPYNKYVESNPFGELNNVVEAGLMD